MPIIQVRFSQHLAPDGVKWIARFCNMQARISRTPWKVAHSLRELNGVNVL